MLRIILLAVAGLAVLAVLFVASGYAMPRTHQARAQRVIHASRGKVWKLVSDMAGTPAWLSGTASVETLPPENGHPVWKQTGSSGDALVFITLRSEAPALVVREVRDPGGAFGGTWTIALADNGADTGVTIVEDGWIAFAPFRPIQRFFIGYDTTMRAYLKDLAGAAEAVR